jgi:hypothetical protein
MGAKQGQGPLDEGIMRTNGVRLAIESVCPVQGSVVRRALKGGSGEVGDAGFPRSPSSFCEA